MHPSVSGVADGSIFTKSSSMVTATVEFSDQERSPVLAVFIGVTAALIFGSADFAGGVAAKRISAVRVTAIGGLSGLVVLLLVFPLFPSVWSTKGVLLGGITGTTGAFAVVLLYACLAIGPMSILSPLTAVISAVVPVLSEVLLGEHLNALGYVGIVVALAAVVLVAIVLRERIAPVQIVGLALALVAAALLAVGEAPPC